MIELTVNISKADYRKVLFGIFYRRPAVIIITLIGMGHLLVFTFLASEGGATFIASTFMSVLIASVMTFGFPVFLLLINNYIFKTKKNLFQDLNWTITESGFSIVGTGQRWGKSWSEIFKIRLHGKWVVIYLDPINFTLIPLGAFRSNEDYDDFLRWVIGSGKLV